MKKYGWAFLGVLGLTLVALPAQARHCGRSFCAPTVCGDIGPACGITSCNIGPTCGVTYVDQVVTQYRTEMRARTETRTVKELATREVVVPFTYTEAVQKVTPTVLTEPFFEPVTEQEIGRAHV